MGGDSRDGPAPAARGAEDLLATLAAMGREETRAGMARFGIETARADGVSVSELRGLARRIGRDHALARALWASGRHEARILAVLIADPTATDESLVDRWVRDIDSWDLCDQFCNELVRLLPCARTKAMDWSGSGQTFVKRAGFTLMACLVVHDKGLEERDVAAFLGAIEAAAADERNFVKKAVSWALRQIGKRSTRLNAQAVAVARRLRTSDSRAARRVGSDACRELTSQKVQARLARINRS